MQQTELSIIIVNYNGLKYLKGCFDSLYDKCSGINVEIVVLDNNSVDDSCIYIKKNYPQVKLIESKENLGFGKGNNAAVNEARGKYLLLINNDTIVLDEVSPLLSIMDKDPQIGALGINMLNGDRQYLKAAGNFPSVRNLLELKKLWKGGDFSKGKFNRLIYDVDWLNGSFLLIPKKVYDVVGGFDPRYFMYAEDVDLCRQIANKGYRRVFIPGFSYIHFVGFSTARNTLLINGLKLYALKHFKGYKRTAALFALKINAAIKSIKSKFTDTSMIP